MSLKFVDKSYFQGKEFLYSKQETAVMVADYFFHVLFSPDLQHAFDVEWRLGYLPSGEHYNMEAWNPNASENAIFGYKLMVQTGDLDEPIDFNRVSSGF